MTSFKGSLDTTLSGLPTTVSANLQQMAEMRARTLLGQLKAAQPQWQRKAIRQEANTAVTEMSIMPSSHFMGKGGALVDALKLLGVEARRDSEAPMGYDIIVSGKENCAALDNLWNDIVPVPAVERGGRGGR